MPESVSPVVIVGAGPTGIACAIELGTRGILAVCYDKGFLLDTIYHFPEEMRWYSTRDLLDIAGIPFAVPDAHPTRLEALAYYRAVAEKFQVKVVPHTEIVSIRPSEGGGLVVILSDSSSEASAKEAAKDLPSSVETEARELSAPAAIIATGFFHNPRHLNVPGEDL
ncbi:MAG TPA: NAD(P)-binding domain-containing protein, partial [Thermoanaerobaculia bacterium]